MTMNNNELCLLPEELEMDAQDNFVNNKIGIKITITF